MQWKACWTFLKSKDALKPIDTTRSRILSPTTIWFVWRVHDWSLFYIGLKWHLILFLYRFTLCKLGVMGYWKVIHAFWASQSFCYLDLVARSLGMHPRLIKFPCMFTLMTIQDWYWLLNLGDAWSIFHNEI